VGTLPILQAGLARGFIKCMATLYSGISFQGNAPLPKRAIREYNLKSPHYGTRISGLVVVILKQPINGANCCLL